MVRPAGPDGNDTQPGAPSAIGSFKARSAGAPNQVAFPTAVLYVKEEGSASSSSSGGLSAGAIAGIAVGAAAAAAVLAAAAWVLLRRRVHQLRAPEQQPKVEEGSGSPTHCATSVSSSQQHSGLSSGRLGTAGFRALPELAEHVAAQDEAAAYGSAPTSCLSSAEDVRQLLPAHLRDSIVDSSKLTYLRRPNGQLWELGAGAFGHVYKVEYQGDIVAAKEASTRRRVPCSWAQQGARVCKRERLAGRTFALMRRCYARLAAGDWPYREQPRDIHHGEGGRGGAMLLQSCERSALAARLPCPCCQPCCPAHAECCASCRAPQLPGRRRACCTS